MGEKKGKSVQIYPQKPQTIILGYVISQDISHTR